MNGRPPPALLYYALAKSLLLMCSGTRLLLYMLETVFFKVNSARFHSCVT